MRYKRHGMIAILIVLMLIIVGCTNNNEENQEEEPEDTPSDDPVKEEEESVTWKSYENDRFYYEMNYPDKWILEESGNGDGVVFRVMDGDQDLRVYGTHYEENISTPYENAEDPNLTRNERSLPSGSEATIIQGETDGGYHYEMVVVENEFEYHFVAQMDEKFYQENEEIILAMVDSFDILEDALQEAMEEKTPELTEEKAMEIEEEFFDLVFTPKTVGRTNEIENYQSKEALVSDASKLADQELAREYVDYFYAEREGSLYVVPKEGPAKILPDSPYELNQVDEKTVEVVQEEENELRGAYRLIVEFSYMDEQWKISDRTIQFDE
ncbi:MAG TPA: hypothetical protein DHN33_00415 [Eubacteriaceae bacterium]|nr:hypothetical protein [Eubacteriaceae bacterium]